MTSTELLQNFFHTYTVLSYFAIGVWAILGAIIVLKYIQKEFRNGNVWILYLLNSSSIYFAGRTIQRLLYGLSESNALPEFTDEAVNKVSIIQSINSIAFLLLLMIVNLIYCRWILKEIKFKTIGSLFLADLLLLFIGIWMTRTFLLKLGAVSDLH